VATWPPMGVVSLVCCLHCGPQQLIYNHCRWSVLLTRRPKSLKSRWESGSCLGKAALLSVGEISMIQLHWLDVIPHVFYTWSCYYVIASQLLLIVLH